MGEGAYFILQFHTTVHLWGKSEQEFKGRSLKARTLPAGLCLASFLIPPWDTTHSGNGSPVLIWNTILPQTGPQSNQIWNALSEVFSSQETKVVSSWQKIKNKKVGHFPKSSLLFPESGNKTSELPKKIQRRYWEVCLIFLLTLPQPKSL